MASPSAIVVEINRAAGDTGATIICGGKVPNNYEKSFIVNLHKGFYLFDLILYVPVNIFQLRQNGSSWIEPVLR